MRWFYVNSKMIKSAARAGADIKGLVPDIVYERLTKKINEDQQE
jgi:phosphopantetheine adenylyltransferase